MVLGFFSAVVPCCNDFLGHSCGNYSTLESLSVPRLRQKGNNLWQSVPSNWPVFFYCKEKTIAMKMKKEILLAIGVIALYAAAKEYGVNSLDDLKKIMSPYLKLLDMEELTKEA